MSLAPKWAHAAAVLGLKMQLYQLDEVELPPEIKAEARRQFRAEIDRIAAMKD